MTKADRKRRDGLKTLRQKRSFVSGIYAKKFKTYNSKYAKIIYVGILNSSMVGALYKKQHFDLKIYLDVSESELIKRFYTREVVEGILTGARYLKMVVDKEWYIPSSAEILEDHRKSAAAHEKLGYALMTDKKIVRRIRSLR